MAGYFAMTVHCNPKTQNLNDGWPWQLNINTSMHLSQGHSISRQSHMLCVGQVLIPKTKGNIAIRAAVPHGL